MKKFFSNPKLFLLVSMVLLTVLFNPLMVFAQDKTKTPTLINSAAQTADFSKVVGYETGDVVPPPVLVGRYIGYALNFLGLIFFVLVVAGGWKWLLARGNEEEIKKAKGLIMHSIIGLVIVLAAYLLSYVVVDYIIQATQTTS